MLDDLSTGDLDCSLLGITNQMNKDDQEIYFFREGV